MIDRNSPVPLYHQIKERLRQELPAPGQQLPAEHELVQRFGVSRMTVVQAMKALEREGIIERIQGKGTFVAPPKFEQRLAHLHGFTQELQRRGMTPRTQLLSLDKCQAPVRVANDLRLAPGEPVWKIARLRLTEDGPIGLQIAYLPVRLCPDLTADGLTGSLYAVVKARYGLVAMRAQEFYSAAVAGKDQIAHHLGIHHGAPLLEARRITYGANDVPWEHVHSFLRGDRYILQVDLRESEPT